ncbi:MAG: sigma-54-dependent Fis family transcriptional regulator [Phyllobacteriaceae bacterium]|nr:sigma-54-dependent Fis family transcriptional regulator [Phyllobacteriaceae bacterium]
MANLVLIVDDDPVQRRLVDAALKRAGHETLAAENGEAALAALSGAAGRMVGAMVLDLVMPGLDGMGVLAGMAERGLTPPVIVQTSKGGIDTVVQAMRAGAFDFVVKPVSPERIQQAVAAALKIGAREAAPAAKSAAKDARFSDIVTRSPAMERVLRLARKAAESNIPVLIEGESGVGKELLARAIQAGGGRKGKAFVTVNCGAIPDNLVESILFGHEKGSFTGATEKHVGKFVEANGGTLFLDEIGDLPLDVQVKLLRAVQEGEVDPVGSRQTQKVDIRIISATHRDLATGVGDGRFREDLFYRLNVFPIAIPSLRERREDIPDLARLFVKRIAREEGRADISGLTAGALSLLGAHDWPGNIRELENAVFRAVVLADGGELTEAEFPQIAARVGGPDFVRVAAARAEASPPMPATVEYRPAESPAVDPRRRTGGLDALDAAGNVRPLAVVEEEMIRFAISHYGGQMSEVARRLGIGRSTLYRKMKDYGIEPAEERGAP